MGRSENSLSRHKEEAWKAFSLYIRTRDCLKTMDRTDMGKCVTCNQPFPRTGQGCLQAGHFLDGRNNSILFDERAVHAQCWQCNQVEGGKKDEYLYFMLQTYGQEVVDELRSQKQLSLKLSTAELVDIRRKYEALTDILLKKNLG